MVRLSGVVAACVAGVAACGVVRADIETWQVPLSATIQDNSGEQAFQYPLPLFNTQGGLRVLTDVQIGGTVTMATNTQVTNNDVMPWSFTVQYAAGVTGALPGGAFMAFESSSQSEPGLFPTATRPFQFLFDAPITATVPNIAAFASPNGATVMQTGTFTALLQLPSLTQLQWSPAQSLMGGRLEIRYVYQLIPTPGAAAVIMGLGTLMLRRRRGE